MDYNTYAIIGLQFGDECKGKIIQIHSQDADMIIKFQGGSNGGHSLKITNDKLRIDMLPIGIFNNKAKCILSAGTVIDADAFLEEVYNIEKTGRLLTNLFIDGRAHLVMPYHLLVDQAKESILGKNIIKVSKKGIAPAYMDKIAKVGIRVADLLNEDTFSNKLLMNLKEKNDILERYYEKPIEFEYILDRYKEYIEKLRYRIVDGMTEINKAISEGKKVIFEGSQATMLDINFGTYPNVSSTVTTIGSAISGTGVAPQKIRNIIGVFKAYSTRAGEGLFPTEDFSFEIEQIREKGREYNSQTNITRRVGWLDLVVLKYSIMINGVTELNMTKLDVLSGLKNIKIALAYEYDGLVHQSFPMDIDDNKNIGILYKEFEGWEDDISDIKEYDDLPDNCRRLIEYIEGYLEVPITLISVGANKDQTIRK